MLYFLDDNGNLVQATKIPFRPQFDAIRSRLTDAEFEAIEAALRAKFDVSRIETAGWLPGKHWAGTPYMPIYLAAHENESVAAKFFGQTVWKVVMEHPEPWMSGRYEKNGEPMSSRTYFRIRKDEDDEGED